MTLTFSLLFFLIVIWIYSKERNKYYIITPAMSLGFPFAVIMLFVSMIDIYTSIKFDKMSFLVPLYSCLYFILFTSIGYLLKRLLFLSKFNKDINLIIKENIEKKEIKFKTIYISMLIFFIVFIFFFFIMKFGFRIPNIELIKNTFSIGFIAHIINFTTALMLVNFAITLNENKYKINYVLSLFWLIFLLGVSAKYYLFIYVITIFFEYFYLKKRKLGIKRLINMTIMLSGLFILVYILRFINNGINLHNIPYDFIFNHFLYYLTGSFYAYSIIIENSLSGNIGYGILFAPLMNLIARLYDYNIITTVADFIPVNIIGLYNSTNVFTIFGSFQYETSVFGTIILIIIIAFIIYYYFYKMFFTRNLIYVVLTSYLCAILVISFFNSFFGTLNVWEMFFSILLISFVERLKK